MATRQLTLNVRIPDRYSLENFVPGTNTELLARLAALAGASTVPETVFVWGPPGSGKSHLLQAICRTVSDCGGAPVYLSLAADDEFTPEVLEGLADRSLVCIDDVDAVAGDRRWETALLALYEAARERTTLVLAATAAPPALSLALPDLVSRLRAGLVYGLQPLDDGEKLRALQARARERGFELPDDAGLYVLKRYPRDMHALFALLDRMDRASLEEQRRITIPFLRRLEQQD